MTFLHFFILVDRFALLARMFGSEFLMRIRIHNTDYFSGPVISRTYEHVGDSVIYNTEYQFLLRLLVTIGIPQLKKSRLVSSLQKHVISDPDPSHGPMQRREY